MAEDQPQADELEDDDELKEEDVIGYDQNGEPVGHHSTGSEACPAVYGEICPIAKHNVDEDEEE